MMDTAECKMVLLGCTHGVLLAAWDASSHYGMLLIMMGAPNLYVVLWDAMGCSQLLWAVAEAAAEMQVHGMQAVWRSEPYV